MASDELFQCSVITPEREVLDTPARSVIFPAHDGEMGVLINRAPLVCKLGIGELRIEAPDREYLLFIDGGFAQVVENRLTILTEQAQDADKLDRQQVESAMVEARSLPISDDESFDRRQNAVRRAQVKLKLLERQHA